MGQVSNGFKVTIRLLYLKIHFRGVKSLFPCIFLVMFGCSNNNSEKWMEAKESCVYESETPPLRRVINYENPDLCSRQTLVKKKKQKRLRELIDKK